MKTIKSIAAIFAALATLAACQKEIIPQLEISPANITLELEGGNGTFSVTSNTDWTVTCNGAWLTVTPVAGNGNGQVTVTAGENTSLTAPEATLTFTAGGTLVKSVKVTQKAKVPYINANQSNIACPALGADYKVAISSNVAWTAVINEEGKSWMTLDKTSGEGDGEITVSAATQLNLQTRKGVLTITETASGASVEVTFEQEAGKPSAYTDSLALIAFYNASDGANWAKNKWDLTTPYSTWYGIGVNEEGRVDTLKFGTKVITLTQWQLPEEIGTMDELLYLGLGTNCVKGNLPESIYNLTKLQTLDLSNNFVTGSFSAKIANWKEMTYITMLGNKDFGGSIPNEIGALKKLFRLNLSNTSISGTIPAGIFDCESMQELMAFSCNLSGEIPDLFDKYQNNFKILMLYGNTELTGPLPASLGRVKSSAATFSLHLYNCSFTGNIPESYATLPAGCKQLRVQGNKLSGTVPNAVRAHDNWSTWKAETYIFPQQEGYGLQ